MGWVLSVTPRPRFTPGTHLTGGWVGLRAGPNTEAGGKILWLCRGSKPGLPACSQVIYWLGYTGSPNLAQETCKSRMMFTVKMGPICSFKTLLTSYKTTWCHNTEHFHRHLHRSQYLISQAIKVSPPNWHKFSKTGHYDSAYSKVRLLCSNFFAKILSFILRT
jgi:hypothetical protein